MLRAPAFALVLTLVVTLAPQARANDAWADIEVIDDTALDDLRGGFNAGGVEFGLGAVITTYANGQMALQTQLTLSNSGAVASQLVGELGQTIESMTPEQRAALGLENIAGSGVVINDEAGMTALVHNITEGAMQNLILNTASGRELTQDVDVTITLPGFENVQDALSQELFGLRLSEDLGFALSRGP